MPQQPEKDGYRVFVGSSASLIFFGPSSDLATFSLFNLDNQQSSWVNQTQFGLLINIEWYARLTALGSIRVYEVNQRA